MTVVMRSGSRRPTRAATSAASVDLPIPPTPCSTSPAVAEPTRSADQRRRSMDRIGRDAGRGGSPSATLACRAECDPATGSSPRVSFASDGVAITGVGFPP